MQAPPGEISSGRLAEVLRDFGRAPGNFPVRLGEPRELHAHLETMASWALGRLPDHLQGGASELRDAAVLFILRACFAPGGTHYQVLGLTPQTLTAESLRSRYRALIRLTHPDMAVEGLPPNAAGIVNRAQEVLGDPELRQQYDERLARRNSEPGPVADATTVRRLDEQHISLAERWRSLNARFPNQTRLVATVLGVSVLLVGLLVLVAREAEDGRTLIVREPTDGAPISPSGDAAVAWKPMPSAERAPSQIAAISPETGYAATPPNNRRAADPLPERAAPARGAVDTAVPERGNARSATSVAPPADPAALSTAARAPVPTPKPAWSPPPVPTLAAPAPAPVPGPAPVPAPTLRESVAAWWNGDDAPKPAREAPAVPAVMESVRPLTPAPAVAPRSTSVPTQVEAADRGERASPVRAGVGAAAESLPAPRQRTLAADAVRDEPVRAPQRTNLPVQPPPAATTRPVEPVELAMAPPVRTPVEPPVSRSPTAQVTLPSVQSVPSVSATPLSAHAPEASRSVPDPLRAATPQATPPLPATTARVVSAATAPVTRSPASSPAGSGNSPQPVFAVDAPTAKRFLVSIVAAIERPSEARMAHDYLLSKKVVGSLLQPALQLMNNYPDVVIERMRWTDSERPGVLRVQGVIVLNAQNPQSALGQRVSYRLLAEFQGTATGTVLAEFDLKEGS